MIKKFFAVILVALQFVAALAFAQTTGNIPGCYGYVIAFGNGIMNSRAQMQAGQFQLSAMFGGTYNGQKVTYVIAENPSDGLLADLVDVIEQKIAEDSSVGWEIAFKGWLGSSVGLIPLIIYNKLQELFNKFLAEVVPQRIADLRRKYEEQYDYVDAEVDAHVAMFTQLIKTDKRKVMLVAHSQGNLYANASYKRVYLDPDIKTKSFDLVGVASPANFVAGGGPYMTSGNDLVITALRSLVSSDTLPANIDVPFTFDDIQGHGFLPIYTNEAYAGSARLKEMGTAQLSALEDPDKDSDNDLKAYRWFYAKGLREDPSEEPLPHSGRVIDSVGCFDNETETGSCRYYYEHYRDSLKTTEVSIQPAAACNTNCNDPVNATFGNVWWPSVLMPGEPLPTERDPLGYLENTTTWTVIGTAKEVLNSLIFPRVFNPDNPAYIGFSRKDAKIRYLERDGDWWYVAWYPLYDIGPATWTRWTNTFTYAGMKSCKAQ